MAKAFINRSFINVDALRQSPKGFKTPVGHISEKKGGPRFTMWLATDQETGEPRVTANGKSYLLNVKRDD